MKVLAVMAAKGGTAKSTMTRSLAVQALIDGRRAAIVDADPQGTCLAWSRRREAPAPAVLSTAGMTLQAALRQIESGGGEFTIIDSPPHAQPIISEAARLADSCLIPTGVFPEDLETVGVTAAIAKGAGKPAAIVLTRLSMRVSATTLARAALTSFALPICPIGLSLLVTHPYASAKGLVAAEHEPGGKGAVEIAGIYDWLKQGGFV